MQQGREPHARPGDARGRCDLLRSEGALENEPAAKAATRSEAAAEQALTYTFEAWTRGANPRCVLHKTAAGTLTEAAIEIALVPGSYDFLFWADYGTEAYETGGPAAGRREKYTPAAASERDAFACVLTDVQWNGGNAVSAELKRPLAAEDAEQEGVRHRRRSGCGYLHGRADAVRRADRNGIRPANLNARIPDDDLRIGLGRRRLPLRSVQRGTHRRPFGHGGKYDQDTRRTAAATELHVPRDGDVRMTDDRIRISPKSQNEVPQNKLQTVELHPLLPKNRRGGNSQKAQQTMKKLFLLAAGLALTLTACQKDEGVVSDTTSSSSFTVTIPQNGTRAVTDDFGAGTSANRCILEIYRNDKLYNRIEKGVTGETVTFDDLRLVAQQTYDFVFWADCAEGSEGNFTDKTYNTANLKSITEIGPFVGNSDERDAFFAHETFEVTGSFSRPVTLKRPFGLLVVKTNDLNEIRDEALKPTGYEVAFKGLPTTFNALTGEVSGSADVSYKATEFAKTDGTISMDFLWATESGAALSDFTMTFYNGGTEICTNDAFTNIPIRRNYRTNVSGNLLTRKGTISVTIDPEFEGDIPQDVDQVKDIAAANEAFAKGKTNVVVTDAPTEEATLVLPSTTAPYRLPCPH